METQTRRLPLAVHVLALGIFCLGTSEFMLAGLLPQIAAGLDVSIPDAGMLISGFAIGMLVGAPLMTLATLRLPQRATLLGAAAVFGFAHVVPFTVDGYSAQLAGRVVAAVACATYWAVAAVIATKLAGPQRTARALAVLVGGLTLANVVGVPAGTWIGGAFGWRAAFAAVAVAAAAVFVLLRSLVPAMSDERTSIPMRDLVRSETHAFRDRRLWLALATTAGFQAAVFCAFSYLAPLLTDVAGIPERYVPLVLLLFGLGTFVGVTVGGRYADRDMLANVVISLTAMVLALLLLAALAGSRIGVVVAVFVLGAASFSIAAALNGRVFAFAGDAPTLAASVNVSAFNVGNALGPWLGGLVIGAGLGLRAPIWMSVLLGVLALGFAGTSWRLERSRVTVPVEAERAAC
ncbi:Cmx/CmrA family chloramphenicol efflux MFS transporter [Solicola gregarius]|uniref:MFS transporter n=1 Tax=Solicola gregarius TaxID=2908642 RepID=A0AA46YNI2_9ACTN|nr:Cmx/CmrA family chloramphenicol efflux MFS transporter [Solicola gregarius]UYM07496.1 MFS transporter [Solicola gregarius]